MQGEISALCKCYYWVWTLSKFCTLSLISLAVVSLLASDWLCTNQTAGMDRPTVWKGLASFLACILERLFLTEWYM